MLSWRELPVLEKLEIYDESLRRYAKCKNAYRVWQAISKDYDIRIDRNTILLWVKGLRNPSKKYFNRLARIPSPELAYVILSIRGDGWFGRILDKRGKGYRYEAHLWVRDRDFAETFATAATIALGRTRPYGIYISKTQMCHVILRSKMLYELLEDSFNDSRKFEYFLEHSSKTVASAVRGFFDAEGGPCVSINYRGEFSSTIEASNSNREMLQYVQRLLSKLGIESRIKLASKGPRNTIIEGRMVTFTKDAYAIVVSAKLHVIRFIKIIGSSIARKHDKMVDIMKCLKLPYAKRSKIWLDMYAKSEDGTYVRKESRLCYSRECCHFPVTKKASRRR